MPDFDSDSASTPAPANPSAAAPEPAPAAPPHAPLASPAPLARRRRWKRAAVFAILLAVALPLALPLIALAVLAQTDWNGARPWLNDRIGAAIQRPFAVRGDLVLSWERQPDHGDGNEDSGGLAAALARRLPRPHLVAHDVHIGNPASLAPAADMASAGKLAFSIELLPLLRRDIVVPELRFEYPALLLRRDAGGHNNWTFPHADQPWSWRLAVRRVALSKGTIDYTDAMTEVVASAAIEPLAGDPVYGIAWTLNGSWKGQAIGGGGKAGAVLSLQHQDAPYPLSASLDVGGTRLAATGTLTRPQALTELDMRLRMSGPSMERLYALTGVLLPETPPFATEGRLTGKLGANAGHWFYDNFTGTVGASDIAGKLEYATADGRRPHLSGAVRSTLLRVTDLGPLIGADSNASKQARGVADRQPGGRVLPVEPFRTGRWTALDADVDYRAARITRQRKLPISQVETMIHLKQGVLSLAPLDFNIAGGRFTSTVTLDGSGKVARDAIRAELRAGAHHLRLKELFPRLGALQATTGELSADIALSATGNSVAGLLGASNGELKGVVDNGSISRLLLEEMGLNLGNVALTALVGDKQVKLNCMVTDFAVSDGVMHTRLFAADTAEARLDVSGTIDLANEKMDLTVKPEAKGVRVLSLRSPVHVRGSFKAPVVSVDREALAKRAGGALALGLLSPVAALLPLIDTGPGRTASCAALTAQGGGKPVAPPPGKTLTERKPAR